VEKNSQDNRRKKRQDDGDKLRERSTASPRGLSSGEGKKTALKKKRFNVGDESTRLQDITGGLLSREQLRHDNRWYPEGALSCQKAFIGGIRERGLPEFGKEVRRNSAP